MDSLQMKLSSLLRPPKATDGLKHAYIAARGIADLDTAAAATLMFEGTEEDVKRQEAATARLVSEYGGLWGGAKVGERGYNMTYAIAYALRSRLTCDLGEAG